MKTVPVYLFTGFLESGKTTFIRDTLSDPDFRENDKTLLIVCEEGMEEYDEKFQKETNTAIVTVERAEDLTYDFLKTCHKLTKPNRVMIEFNGMWNLTNFLDTVDFPSSWLLVQILTTVDASTFEMYLTNIRSILLEQFIHSEMIVFNRCDENTNKLYLRNNVKAMNKGAQIIYETVDGEIVDLEDDEMPFDLDAEVISINDNDYGLWYMDATEHPDKYDGKNIELKGKVIANRIDGMNNVFIIGRYAMVCCADDTSLIGLLVHYDASDSLKVNDWVSVRAKVHVEFDEEYHGDVPILYAEVVVITDALEDELVYFN